MANTRIRIGCMACAQGRLARGDNDSSTDPSSDLELTDSNGYHWRCPLGHDEYLILQHPRFELLMMAGGDAMRDGYPREPVV